MGSNPNSDQNRSKSKPKPESKPRRKHVFDRGLDFELTYRKLARLLGSESGKRRCYVAIALLQLRNGLRAVEAVRAFKYFLATKQLEFEIPVAKKRVPETRLVVVPAEFASVNLDTCVEMLSVDDKKITHRYKNWLLANLKINTHSLRYAFITYLLKHGVSPSIIAKITRHSKLDFILHYTQQKAAEEILKSLM